MCRFRIFLIFFLSATLLSAANGPEKVYRITYVQKSNEWYKNQATLWEEILQLDKSNEEAWMNLYKARRYAKFEEDGHIGELKQKRLDSLISEMAQYIPETYTYYYLKALNAQNVIELDIKSMEYAHKRWPSEPEILYELILYYEVQGDKEKVRHFARQLYESEDIARGLLEYNANMLLSAQPGSVLFTNGDNDTYPAMILQKAQSFREDVAMINVHMAFGYREYLDKLLKDYNLEVQVDQFSKTDILEFFRDFITALSGNYPEKKIYLAATLNKAFIDSFKQNLYLVGLAYRFSKDRLDNLSILEDNVKNSLRLDYLFDDWYSGKYPATPLVTKLNQNYIVIFMNVAEYLADKGQTEEARRYQNRALELAKRSDNKKMIQMINKSQF